MPEGDRVHLVARKLHRALAGARITRSDFRVPRYATADVGGQTVAEVVARGKHILMRTGADVTVHTHLAMEGGWHLARADSRTRPGARAHEIRAIVETAAWRATGYRLAIVEVIPTASEAEVLGHLGPDPLGEDWDPDEAARRMKEHDDDTIAAALLDQTIVAGFGNVYRNEICFLRGLHPDTLVRDVADVGAVISLGARLLRANRETAAMVTTGDTRRGRKNWVYGRAHEPCLRCGTPIARRADPGARVTYWCPACQPAH